MNDRTAGSLFLALCLGIAACGSGVVETFEGADGGGTNGSGDGGQQDGDASQPDSDAGVADLCSSEPSMGKQLPAPNDPRSSREIYDDIYGQYLPAHEDFGWEDAAWITRDWVESLHFPTPPPGLANETYHHLFDFNVFNFERPGLAAFDREDDNEQLFASTNDPLEILKHYDPTEWMPAAATTYTRTPTSDIMATQFWFRGQTDYLRPHIARAMELCPDCDDVFTPLSHNDLYKIIEIRFVRYQDGTPQLSRVFKLIGVDASGAMEAHTQNDDYRNFGTIDGEQVTAKWRMELSGQLSQRYWNSETEYIRLMPVLVRASSEAALFQYYDGRFDRELPTDDPFERQYNPAADGDCIRDCHAELCQAGRNVEGYYYVRNEICECRLLIDEPGALGSDQAFGRCEAWGADEWPDYPSSYGCGDL